ncbi:MAG: HDOD domain-containing protein [Spirochaetaceae bacterium]|jgi:putative nucleotidyltransferase with HDIG domain|nr:HDOD domain-containing protein [Spirochaetaceae bacterium]
MAIDNGLVVDEAEIKKSVLAGLPITITTYTLPHEMETHIGRVLASFLKYAGHENLCDYIEYCTLELAVNAKKANTKRIYFMEKGLDINNPEQYRQGMLNFKKDTLENMAYYLRLQKDNGFYIKVNMLYRKDAIQIEVRNNAVVSKIELTRIHDKIARSRRYSSLEDAFSQVLDDSEGAGLGLVVLVLMLKKMSLSEDSFNVTGTDTETIARLTIPIDQTVLNNNSDITKIVVEYISELPHFPESIIRIQDMLSDPRVEIMDIAGRISMDPAITADVIKLVNSAQYMTTKKIDSVSSAVKILGLTGVKNMLYSYGAKKLLGDDNEEKKALWKHCYKTAFFAFNLIKNFYNDKHSIEDVYLGGILHDIGKIVLQGINPELASRIKKFCEAKNISSVTIEDVRAGMNHAEVGALIAEKWNFPENLVAAIRFHHNPSSAPKEYSLLVDTVYLANMLCEIERGGAVFDQLDEAVLSRFKITRADQVDRIIKVFSKGFKKER